jgi:hypothetical protein
MMETTTLVYAALGGVLPDALRILKWSRQRRKSPNPLKDSRTYISIVLQIGLGLLGANLLSVTTPLQCVAVGYAAPDVLTRILSGVTKTRGATLGAAPEAATHSLWNGLISWWAT